MFVILILPLVLSSCKLVSWMFRTTHPEPVYEAYEVGEAYKKADENWSDLTIRERYARLDELDQKYKYSTVYFAGEVVGKQYNDVIINIGDYKIYLGYDGPNDLSVGSKIEGYGAFTFMNTENNYLFVLPYTDDIKIIK